MTSDAMHDYLEDLAGKGHQGLERGATANVLRRMTTHGMRDSAKMTATKALQPVMRRRAARMAEHDADLRLHIGCGPNHLDGWLNLDVVGMPADVIWDLRAGLPFPDDGAKAIFAEHVFEHFELADAITLLDECYRVMRPGGIMRIGVPDFGKYLRSYASDRSEIEALRPGRPTALLALAEVVLAHGHRSAWDGETLTVVLEAAGFVDARVCDWGDSWIEPAPDSEARRPESVYAEARKPRVAATPPA
jgi:predicted SAM-dependent methyltransferase